LHKSAKPTKLPCGPEFNATEASSSWRAFGRADGSKRPVQLRQSKPPHDSIAALTRSDNPRGALVVDLGERVYESTMLAALFDALVRQQGLSFRGLLDELRTQIALKYLRTTKLANEEIALALGFRDAVIQLNGNCAALLPVFTAKEKADSVGSLSARKTRSTPWSVCLRQRLSVSGGQALNSAGHVSGPSSNRALSSRPIRRDQP
jgi:hypothetical protein